jgi:hypothetical protein
MTLGRYMLLPTVLLLCAISFADNGHLISTTKTSEYNVAIFAEPWPPRVGELQLQTIVTDAQGRILLDPSILSIPHQKQLTLLETGEYSLEYTLAGAPQHPITFVVLPKASVFIAYLPVWLFLIIGLIFIILREKLAKIHARRYPSL